MYIKLRKYGKIIPLVFYAGLFFIIGCDDITDSESGGYQSSYEVIQNEIFDQNCIQCHITGNSYANQSGLILTADVSYEQLIDVVPLNSAALEEGLFRVSSLGELEGVAKSFLWEKINAPDLEHFNSHQGFGSIMPLGMLYLTNGQLDFIETWIQAGAPSSGHVAELNLLDDESRFELTEFAPLVEPENGIQIHLGPFEVPPQFETEFFYYTNLNIDTDIYINKVEIAMQSGSHHFIMYTYPDNFPVTIPEGTYRQLRNPDGSYDPIVQSLMEFQIFLTGTQEPTLELEFPPGIALKIPAGTGIDQNPHYINYTDDTYLGEVYTNLHYTDEADIEYVAEILQLGVYQDLYLPPNEITTIEKTFMFEDILTENGLDSVSVNIIHIFQLFSHAHEHLVDFEVEYVGGIRNGEQVYYANDWEHPPIEYYGDSYENEAIQIVPGEGLNLIATYDNWTNELLTFGFLSTDEMMILFGYFYTE